MSKTIIAAGYIAHNGDAIYGFGSTDDEALESAEQWFDGDASRLTVEEASAALLANVADYGGNCAWVYNQGIAITRDEEEEIEADQA